MCMPGSQIFVPCPIIHVDYESAVEFGPLLYFKEYRGCGVESLGLNILKSRVVADSFPPWSLV